MTYSFEDFYACHPLAEKWVEWRTEWHLEFDGGYPLDCGIIGDVFVVADLDDGKERNATKLYQYRIESITEWLNEAQQFLKKNGGETLSTAFWETAPSYFGV